MVGLLFDEQMLTFGNISVDPRHHKVMVEGGSKTGSGPNGKTLGKGHSMHESG
jgi:hypothetical protein